MASVWSTTPTIKKTLKDPVTALEIFTKELLRSKEDLQKHGLFFNFTSDPFLPETIDLNIKAMEICYKHDIPVKALTKQTWWVAENILPSNVSIGFTLTGMDEMEPGAATNSDRIVAMQLLYSMGYKIWASIEPVIEVENSLSMIQRTIRFVSHYKIGILSGSKMSKKKLESFVFCVTNFLSQRSLSTIYWKDSLLDQAEVERENLPKNCVPRDYNWWSE